MTSSVVSLDRDEALIAEPVILEIIAVLEGPEELDARAPTLLTDGNGDAYVPPWPGAVLDRALACDDHLLPSGQVPAVGDCDVDGNEREQVTGVSVCAWARSPGTLANGGRGSNGGPQRSASSWAIATRAMRDFA